MRPSPVHALVGGAGRRGRLNPPGMRDGGFTLVELLVVIGVISVLIALLLPALQKARQTALTVKCMSQMRQFGIAYLNYANTYGGWLPTHSEFNPLDAPYVSVAGQPELDAAFYCNFMNGYRPPVLDKIRSHAIGLYRCPTFTPGGSPAWAVDTLGSYSQHYNASWPSTPKGRARLNWFNNAAATAFLIEPQNVPDGSFWDATHKLLTPRHNRGGNILYLDGHVTWMPARQFAIHHLDLREGKTF